MLPSPYLHLQFHFNTFFSSLTYWFPLSLFISSFFILLICFAAFIALLTSHHMPKLDCRRERVCHPLLPLEHVDILFCQMTSVPLTAQFLSFCLYRCILTKPLHILGKALKTIGFRFKNLAGTMECTQPVPLLSEDQEQPIHREQSSPHMVRPSYGLNIASSYLKQVQNKTPYFAECKTTPQHNLCIRRKKCFREKKVTRDIPVGDTRCLFIFLVGIRFLITFLVPDDIIFCAVQCV